MTIYTPYFYIIQDSQTKIYYAGSKYAKDANPNMFMVEGGYLTSSAIVQTIIEERGLESFIIRRIRTFDTGVEALNYETRFLKRVNAKDNLLFYNKHCNDHLFSFHDDKYKSKMIEMYGVENPSQSSVIKQRKRDTLVKNYGVSHQMFVDEVKQKIKNTNNERRGVDAPAQSPIVLAKMQETCIERFGVRNAFQSEEVKQKLKETHLARRGVEYPAQCPEVMEKIANTNMVKYRTKAPLQNEEVKAKMVDTFNKLKTRPNVALLYRYRNELSVKTIPHYFYRKDDEWVDALLAGVVSAYGPL